MAALYESYYMREIEANEAPGKFGAMLDWIETGEEVRITRRGKAIAVFHSVDQYKDGTRSEAQLAADRILARSEGASLGGLSIKDLINEGRR